MMRVVVFLCVVATLAANPEQMGVMAGQATLVQQENLVEIQTSDRAILNWQAFSIGKGETTRFVQPSVNSAVLNRVMGSEVSQLRGVLESNGYVFLVNPNGIVIGREGCINTAAFIALTADVSFEDFLNSRDLLIEGNSMAEIINLGTIETAAGPVALIAHRVVNEGTIEAPNETVSLVAGHEVLLSPSGNALLQIRPDWSSGGVENKGDIRALEARIQADGAPALAINQQGTIEARSLVEEGGRIFLQAPDGKIAVEGGLDVAGKTGGDIEVRAKDIVVAQGVEIYADSWERGDGGEVILVADDTMEFHGWISGQAFGKTGSGGFAEISGKRALMTTGFADLHSESGKFGTVLFDPGSVTIDTGGGTGYNDFGASYISSFLGGASLTIDTADATGGGAQTITITGGVQISWGSTTTLTLLAGQNIYFDFSPPGELQQTSIINIANTSGFDAIILQTTSSSGSQPSGAYDGVSLQSNTLLETSGGNIQIVGVGGTSNTGGQTCNGVSLFEGVQITTFGTGTITITGTAGGDTIGGANNVGIWMADTAGAATIQSEAGPISLTGTGGNHAGTLGDTNHGIFLSNSSGVTSSVGDIVMVGTAGNSISNTAAVYITNTAQLNSNNLQITGSGGDAAGATGSGGNSGIYIGGGSLLIAGGSVTLTGTCPSNALTNNTGVFIDALNNFQVGGSLQINGTGTGTTTNNYGVQFNTGPQAGSVSITGNISPLNVGTDSNIGASINTTAGSFSISNSDGLSITGIGGGTGTNCYGLSITLLFLNSESAGPIVLTGTANSTGAGSSGLYAEAMSISTTNYDITLNGTAALASNYGIDVTGSGNIQIGPSGVGNLSFVSIGDLFIGSSTGNILSCGAQSGSLSLSSTANLTIDASNASSAPFEIPFSISSSSSANLSVSATGNITIGPAGGGSNLFENDGTGAISLNAGGVLQINSGAVNFQSVGATNLTGGSILLAGPTLTTKAGSSTVTFSGATSVTANTSLVTSGSPLVYLSAITATGAPNLTFNTGAGSLTLNGNVGTSGSPFGTLQFTATGGTTLSGISLFGNSSTFNDAVTLSGGAVSFAMSGSTTFSSTVDGGQGLNVTAGSVSFSSNIGSNSTLGTLSVTGSSLSVASSVTSIQVGGLTTGSSTTTSLNNTSALSISAGGGAISFGGTVAGSSGACNVSGGSLALGSNFTTTSGNINFSTGSITLSDNVQVGPTAPSSTTIQWSASSAITLGTNNTIQTDGNVTLVAGTNFTATGAGTIQATSTSSTLTLVVDNQNNTPPAIGSGYFNFPSTMTLTCGSGGSKVLLWAATPNNGNSFPSTINGSTYTPGVLNVNARTYTMGTNEYVGYWYLVPPAPPDPSFEVIFKGLGLPPLVPPASVVQTVQVAVTEPVSNANQTTTQSLPTSLQGASTPDPRKACGVPSVAIRPS